MVSSLVETTKQAWLLGQLQGKGSVLYIRMYDLCERDVEQSKVSQTDKPVCEIGEEQATHDLSWSRRMVGSRSPLQTDTAAVLVAPMGFPT